MTPEEREAAYLADVRRKARLAVVTMDNRRGQSRAATYELLDMLGLIGEAQRVMRVLEPFSGSVK